MFKLTDNLSVSADKCQYILGKPRQTTRKGVECTILDDLTYHTTMASVLRHAIETEMHMKVADYRSIATLREYYEEYNRLVTHFESVIKEQAVEIKELSVVVEKPSGASRSLDIFVREIENLLFNLKNEAEEV